MRYLVLLLALTAACTEPAGEIVTCSQTWTCGENIVASNTDAVRAGELGHVFCTKPGVDALGGTADGDERAADIAAYESGFAADCNGANVACQEPEVNGEFATCAATCVVGGECDVATAVRVRLN